MIKYALFLLPILLYSCAIKNPHVGIVGADKGIFPARKEIASEAFDLMLDIWTDTSVPHVDISMKIKQKCYLLNPLVQIKSDSTNDIYYLNFEEVYFNRHFVSLVKDEKFYLNKGDEIKLSSSLYAPFYIEMQKTNQKHQLNFLKFAYMMDNTKIKIEPIYFYFYGRSLDDYLP